MMGEPASGDVGGTARTGSRRIALGAAAAVAIAIVLWGGYSHRWPWTGINGGSATLWDWLHLLLLPLAVAVLPVWLRADTRIASRTKSRGAAGLAAFAAVVVLGYTIPWAWTGFRGNTVWDWLKLVALPLAVVLAPRVAELRRAWGPRHTLGAFTGAAVFTAVALGGYLGPWAWTGFTGNTLWDWLNLLFLPLLVPTVVVPLMTPKMIGEVVYLDADGNPIEVVVVEATAGAAAPPAQASPPAQVTPPAQATPAALVTPAAPAAPEGAQAPAPLPGGRRSP